MVEDELSFDDDFAGDEAKYNSSKFDEFLDASATILSKMGSEQKLKIIQRIVKMPHFDDVDLYYLGMYELQNSSEAAAEAPMKDKPAVKPVVWVPLESSKQDRLASDNKSSALKPSKKQERRLKKKQRMKRVTDEYKKVQKSGKFNLKRPRADSEDGDDEKKKKKPVLAACSTDQPVTFQTDHSSEAEEPMKENSIQKAVVYPLDKMTSEGRRPLILRFKVKTPEKSVALKPSTKQERLLKEKQGKKPIKDDECMMMVVQKSGHQKLPWPDSQACSPPAELKEKIKKHNGSEEILVIQKQLRKTDLNPDNGRLSLPSGIINPEFAKYLTPEEEAQLNVRIGKDIPGIEAGLITPSRDKSTICLKKWDMISGPILNLVTGWKDVLKENENEWCEGMIVQVWSFRVASELWFALRVL